jgi:hypothetical protein
LLLGFAAHVHREVFVEERSGWLSKIANAVELSREAMGNCSQEQAPPKAKGSVE